ncbi:MAG: response regulator [Blastochloris sp.]|nr:response regulator [Blastochloris sp.]
MGKVQHSGLHFRHRIPWNEKAGLTMKQPLAFVIDDDVDLGKAFSQALEFSGFSTLQIIDSTQAMPLIILQQPDLVMLDMQMPRMNGREVLEAIRAHEATRHTKVIVATANSYITDETLNNMADLVLQKPVSLSQIMQFARRILTMRE